MVRRLDGVSQFVCTVRIVSVLRKTTYPFSMQGIVAVCLAQIANELLSPCTQHLCALKSPSCKLHSFSGLISSLLFGGISFSHHPTNVVMLLNKHVSLLYCITQVIQLVSHVRLRNLLLDLHQVVEVDHKIWAVRPASSKHLLLPLEGSKGMWSLTEVPARPPVNNHHMPYPVRPSHHTQVNTTARTPFKYCILNSHRLYK